MRIDLTVEEAHWLRYCLTLVAGESPPENSEARQACLSILQKISEAEIATLSSDFFRTGDRRGGGNELGNS